MVLEKIDDITCTAFGNSPLDGPIKRTPWNGFIDLGRDHVGYFWNFRWNLEKRK
jgi:hypothetical protein